MFDVLFSNPWLLALSLVLGLVLLVKGADWLVDGASAIAKRFHISDIVIGLTVVAFGTSMPEFVVNMVAVANGTTDLAITNILGSNIINVFVILGISALICPIASQKHCRDFDIPMSIIAGLLVLAFATVTMSGEVKAIQRWEGAVLLIFFIIFMVSNVRHAKTDVQETESENVVVMNVWKAVLGVVVGLICLVIGGELIVRSSVSIATRLGVSEAIIGLTIVALGTSLPELATSVVAAMKKNVDIALGNVIGSNIFNVFFILGTSAVIRPLPAYKGLSVDALMAALGCALVWLFIKTNAKRELKWWHGACLLLVYAGYLAYRLMTM
ncbi:MAG TPA: sodium:proton exchanger [Bacteroidales bacterium]|nr:sodium:proton exchanger [Bacteroidales bacterium]